MAVSPSKARRLRAAAVKRKLWHRSFADRAVWSSCSYVRSGDACVEMAQHILSMNGCLLQWLLEFSAVSVAVPVVTDGMVLSSVPADMAEPGPREANVGAEAVEEVDVHSFDRNLCAGCWEVLPDICRCGATRLCADCANVCLSGSVAESGHSKMQGKGQGEQDIEKHL